MTGCTKISAGCEHCYAERLARRLRAMGNVRYRNGFEVTLHPDLIDMPRTWSRPRMIFVNSMSDLFHERVPLWFIKRVFETMRDCRQHTFQVLTKRSDRLREVAGTLDWTSNIWIGVTVENARESFRADHLRTVSAAVRFLSCEPLIGPLYDLSLEGIDWVIVGGESGPRCRPMQAEWVYSIMEKCREARVPFFFKQWGGVRKHSNGRRIHGNVYSEMPQRSKYALLRHHNDWSMN